MGLMTELCFRLARRRVLARHAGDAGANPATFDGEAYRAWRTRELTRQFDDHFDAAAVRDQDVLDFGCGEGDLAFHVAGLGPRSVHGIDVDAERVASAAERAASMALPVPCSFTTASDLVSIDLPDEAVDLILCFDVLEHVLEFEQVLAEWPRVLRTGGRIFIWWVPWFHPYGHHIESLVPLPWAHAIFSDRTLMETCARIYDMPEFEPRVWDLDENGRKRPNKWWSLDRLPDVNRLTISRFETECRRIGLKIDRRELHGFEGGGLRRLTHPLTKIPGVREFFTAYVVYELSHAG